MKRKEEEQLQKNNESREMWLDVGDITEQQKDDQEEKETNNEEAEEEEES